MVIIVLKNAGEDGGSVSQWDFSLRVVDGVTGFVRTHGVSSAVVLSGDLNGVQEVVLGVTERRPFEIDLVDVCQTVAIFFIVCEASKDSRKGHTQPGRRRGNHKVVSSLAERLRGKTGVSALSSPGETQTAS